MGRHANAYLLLFSHPFLVESLLRDFVPGEWVRQLDLKAGDRLPPVLPIVLYNGDARWKSPTNVAALVAQSPEELEAFRPRVEYLLLDEGAYPAAELEALPSPVARLFRVEHAGLEALAAEVRRLRQSLEGPEHQELRRAFVICIVEILRRRLGGMRLPETKELEEIETMLAEKTTTWTEMWERQGLEKGRREGESRLLLRQLERRFGPLDEQVRRRVAAASAEQLLEWGERFVDATTLRDVFVDR